MLVAIACQKDMLTDYFGHSSHFSLYEMNQGKMIYIDDVVNSGHIPGTLPAFLHSLDVQVIISGSMGDSALRLLENYGIKIIISNQDKVKNIVQLYQDGKL